MNIITSVAQNIYAYKKKQSYYISQLEKMLIIWNTLIIKLKTCVQLPL